MKTTEMRADYGDSLGTGVRGKYFEAAIRNKGLARIDADLLEVFGSSEEINRALRSFVDQKKQDAGSGAVIVKESSSSGSFTSKSRKSSLKSRSK